MGEKTDLEITKKCAEAMGYRTSFNGLDFNPDGKLPLYCEQDGVGAMRYDPLNDDAQAMALVKKFKLSIYQHQDLVTVSAYFYGGVRSEQHISDLNRAICMCVAKLGAKNE